MQLAAAMGWDEARFWRATPRSFRVATEGWLKSKGVKVDSLKAKMGGAGRLDRMRGYMAQFCRPKA